MASNKEKSGKPAEQANKAASTGWNKLLIISLVILMPILATSASTLARLYKVAGFTRDIPLTKQSCKHVTENRLEGCEDLAIHHRSGQVFLACGSVATRRAHMDLGTYATKTTDGLFIYDLKTGGLKEIAIEGLGEEGYHALGFGIWDPVIEHAKPQNKHMGTAPEDTIVIMAINNRRNESVVEIMEHKLGTTKATVVETARHPLISTPNGILPTSARSFYVSNDLWSRKSSVRTFEMATAREWSSVIYRHEDGSAIVAADHLGFPNGIGASYDGQLLYVSSSHAYVNIYKCLPDGKLILRDHIDVPILSDNLRVNPIDGSILVAGNVKFLDFVNAMKDPDYAAHGAVIRITNNTSADQFYGIKYKQDVIFSGKTKDITPLSVADYSPEYKKLFLGNIVGSGFVICDVEI
ncbi:hypothetical protein BDF19DRAFT_293597 [Syncephalis fuscata]|nr:hypothetical protein BDF19DRAFT_293597 [Syncephalis fuscata]